MQGDISISDITEPLERELSETKEKLRKAVEFIRGCKTTTTVVRFRHASDATRVEGSRVEGVSVEDICQLLRDVDGMP